MAPTPAADILLARAGFLRALIRDLVRDAHEADDVTQEAMLATLRRRGPFTGAPAAWLATVARNIARRLHRERTRRADRERAVARPEATESAADTAARFELHRTLVDRVRKLPEGMRTAILMRYFDELPPREIARRLDVPVATVKTRLQRGLARLRAGLDTESGTAQWIAIAAPWLAEGTRGAATTLLGGFMSGTAVKATLAVLVVAVVVLLARRDSSDDAAERERAVVTGSTAERRSTEPADRAVPGRERPDLPPPVDLDACDRDLDLHGVVVRANGDAVAGASVEALEFPWRRMKTGHHAQRDEATRAGRTRSATDGSFALRLAWGQTVALHVTAPGFAPCRIPLATAGARLRVVLHPGVGLALTFATQDEGRPLEGIAVRVLELPLPAAYPWAVGSIRRGITDAAGRISFQGCVPGARVLVRNGFVPRAYALNLPESGTLTFTCRLDECATAIGTVTDAATGAPIAGARVRLGSADLRGVRTAKDGSYRLSLGGTTWKGGLVAEAPGYAASQAPTGAHVDFALVRGATATGRILDHERRAVAGARVVAVTSPDIGRTTLTDAEGRFAVVNLAPGTGHTLVVTGRGLPRTLVDFRPGDLGDIVLGACGVVEGRLLDVHGAPVAGVAVTLQGEGYGRGRLGAARVPGAFADKEMRVTDDTGRFRFAEQPAGLHRLSAVRNKSTATALVQVTDKDLVARTDLAFTDGDVLVRVRNRTGGAVPAALVWVAPWAGGRRAEGRTDTLGEARIRLAGRPGRIGVRAPRKSGLLSAEPIVAQEGRSEYDFVLVEGAPIAGRVTLDGEPIPGRWYVEIEAAGRSFTTPVTDGRFSTLVPAGAPATVTLRTTERRRGAGGRARTVQRLVTAPKAEGKAGANDLVLAARRIPADRSLAVRVVSPGGQSVAGATVRFAPVPEGASDRLVTDDDGRATLPGLGAQPVEVRVELADAWVERNRWVRPATREITPGDGVVDLRLREVIEIQGAAAGFPAGSRVVVLEGRHGTHATRTGKDGAFRVFAPRGGDGPYELRIVWRNETGMYWAQVEPLDSDRLGEPVRIERR